MKIKIKEIFSADGKSYNYYTTQRSTLGGRVLSLYSKQKKNCKIDTYLIYIIYYSLFTYLRRFIKTYKI